MGKSNELNNSDRKNDESRYPKSGLRPRDPLVRVIWWKWKSPSPFGSWRPTTPGAYRPKPDQAEMNRRANSVEHQKRVTKTQLVDCLEKELEACENKIATYQSAISKMERTKSQMDRRKIAKEGDPFKTWIEVYKMLIQAHTLQAELIRPQIKIAKSI